MNQLHSQLTSKALGVFLLTLSTGFLPAALLHGATPGFQYTIISVTNTAPGQFPVIRFKVTDPNNGGAAYDVQHNAAWTAPAGNSRLFLQIGWDTRDYNNKGSLSGVKLVPPSVAQPIAVNALALSVTSYFGVDGSFQATASTPVPTGASGTGVVVMEGHPAGPDPVTGKYTVRIPVKTVYKYFSITDPTPKPRRGSVDVTKCKVCHGVLTAHGNNRSDEPQACVVCHNPNATDVAWRRAGDGPEVPTDFKRMVHGIHATVAGFRQTPLQVMAFNHNLVDFSKTGQKFNAKLSDCLKCHVPGAYGLPLNPNVQGTTVVTQSVIQATVDPVTGAFTKYNSVDGDPANDLKITPTAAVCSACHDSREVKNHMLSQGASFNALQSQITSGAVKEKCANCHGAGKSEDVFRVHEGSGSSGEHSSSSSDR